MNDLEAFLSAPRLSIDVGTKLSYRRIGSGPPVLLIHGWPLNGATYRGLVRRLARDFTCYVPDLPGAGDSPWDPRTRDIFQDWGELLVRFVDALRLERLAIIGHDSGGGIARVLAAELGERVTLLALTNTEISGHVAPLVRLYMALSRVPGSASLFRMLLSQRWFLRSPLGLAPLFSDPRYHEGEFHEACVAPLRDNPASALRTMRHVRPQFAARLPAIHARIVAPVLLVWGAADNIFRVDDARSMQAEFRDLRGFHVLPGYSTFVHDEAPDRLAAHIAPLLAALNGPTRDARATA